MDPFAPSEHLIWTKTSTERSKTLTDDQISEKYDLKAERIVTETNREKLQNFYESLRRPGQSTHSSTKSLLFPRSIYATGRWVNWTP
jgi:hypothetical protein